MVDVLKTTNAGHVFSIRAFYTQEMIALYHTLKFNDSFWLRQLINRNVHTVNKYNTQETLKCLYVHYALKILPDLCISLHALFLI